jgi:hypothetical protein
MKLRRAILGVTGVFVLGSGASLAFGTAASADPPQPKVTICHRTGSQSNPYVVITPAQHAVDGDLSNDRGQGDHYLEHRGPVGPIPVGEWGDIIPPIPGVHAGLNWTAEGQATYRNGCNAPSVTTTTELPS